MTPNHSIREEFEKAYTDRWCMDDMVEGRPQALWAAKWMGERVLAEDTPSGDSIFSDYQHKRIRQLLKELE